MFAQESWSKFNRFEDRKKKKTGSKEENEKEKMKHKFKKELKGAMREIRKDTQFLSRHQLNEQMERWVSLSQIKHDSN